MPDPSKYVIVVVGPTAVGKTSLAIELAHHFKTEIISADSRQIYREMEIGTAKPSREELLKIKHYFINTHAVSEDFNAGRFEEEALSTLDKIFQKTNVAIVVGGSGLYIDALCGGMDKIPEIDSEIRSELNKRLVSEGLDKLKEELQKVDASYYEVVDKRNPQRIIRALEVFYSSGKPYSEFRKKKQLIRPFKVVKVGLILERDELYKRVNDRMDSMINAGLFEEAKRLFPYRNLNALQTVGYSEIFEFFEGKYDEEEAIRLLKRNSRRYAKRQITWFNKDISTAWFHPNLYTQILKHIQDETGLE